MKIYIRVKEDTFMFKHKTLDSDGYFPHMTDFSLEKLIYYKDYLSFKDNEIQIIDNVLPDFNNGVLVLQDNIRGTFYTWPGYDLGLLRNAAVIPKNSVVIQTETISGGEMRKSVYWDGNKLIIKASLEPKISVKSYGVCTYDFI